MRFRRSVKPMTGLQYLRGDPVNIVGRRLSSSEEPSACADPAREAMLRPRNVHREDGLGR
jgi:hypothetical protein